VNLRRLAAFPLLVIASICSATHTSAAPGPSLLTGTIDGASYRIEVPSPWNGTLLLYSHGFNFSGTPNPAQDAGDPITGAWLLAHGYALAGSNFGVTGWAVAPALRDQIALLDLFARRIGRPERTIAWGQSLGGLVTAGLVQRYPQRFAGAVPMCGILGGSIGLWNEGLDSAFAFKTLLAPHAPLSLIHITNPQANVLTAARVLAGAQRSPQGRARLALVAALADIPGWYDPLAPAPPAADLLGQEQSQADWEQGIDFSFEFAFRAALEQLLGGNPSWNLGVDYQRQLAHSVDRAEVQALYARAGLSLDADLATLQRAPRIAADPTAVAHLSQNITFDGRLAVPMVTMHTTGDGIIPVQNEQAFMSVVRAAGNGRLLHQIFVQRAGHCSFTPAEKITAIQTLVGRLDTGRWMSAGPAALDAEASGLGPGANVLPMSRDAVVPAAPAFVGYQPGPFLRPFDARDESAAATSVAMAP
jgi:pimeloyl-ACP methyl ester carboxylesterase